MNDPALVRRLECCRDLHGYRQSFFHTTQHVECWRRMPSSDSTLCLSTSDDFCGRKPYLTAVESPICPRLQNGWFHAKVRMPFTAHAAKVVNGIREWSPCRRKTMECKASWRHPCWSS